MIWPFRDSAPLDVRLISSPHPHLIPSRIPPSASPSDLQRPISARSTTHDVMWCSDVMCGGGARDECDELILDSTVRCEMAVTARSSNGRTSHQNVLLWRLWVVCESVDQSILWEKYSDYVQSIRRTRQTTRKESVSPRVKYYANRTSSLSSVSVSVSLFVVWFRINVCFASIKSPY